MTDPRQFTGVGCPYPWSFPKLCDREDRTECKNRLDALFGPKVRSRSLEQWFQEFRDARTGGINPPPMQ